LTRRVSVCTLDLYTSSVVLIWVQKMDTTSGFRKFELYDGLRSHFFELPLANLVPFEVGTPSKPITNVQHALVQQLKNPVGTRSLDDQVKPGMKIVLICDDYTRPTPTQLLLPPLVTELNRQGIPDRDITILIAAGHHRQMSTDEKEKKYGKEIVQRFTLVHHFSENSAEMVRVGTSFTGIDIYLNRIAVEADFRIGLGLVEIHPWAGFAGGGKIVNPGIAGKITINQTHSLPILPNVRLGKTKENPFWQTSLESARMLPLNMVINSLLDIQGRLIKLAVGDPCEAQLLLIDEFININELRFLEPPDMVITTAYPKFQQWGQAAISLYNAARIIKPGGVRITLADCPEGLGDCEFEKDFYGRSLGTRHRSTLEYWNHWLGDGSSCSRNTCAVYQHLCDNEISEGIIVSDNLPTEMINQCVYKKLEDAIDYGFRKCGKRAKIAVYDKGGMVLVSLKK
jgi:lactate racemase